jgi:hypothetical protein
VVVERWCDPPGCAVLLNPCLYLAADEPEVGSVLGSPAAEPPVIEGAIEHPGSKLGAVARLGVAACGAIGLIGAPPGEVTSAFMALREAASVKGGA